MKQRHPFLWLGLALLILGVSLWLNLRQPFWLAPPWLRYTPLLYTLLALAWWPCLLYSLGQWPRLRRLRLLLVIGLLVGQCLCLLTLAPIELGHLGLYGGSHPVLGGGFRCTNSPAATSPGLTCELCIVSSDDPPETRRTYEFRKLPGLPLLWLTGLTTQTRREQGIIPCPDY